MEKTEEILKHPPSKKGPFELASRAPQSFYQSSHMEKESQGMMHPCTSNIQLSTVISPGRIMVNKMCYTEQCSFVEMASLFIFRKEENRQIGKEESWWPLEDNYAFDISWNLKYESPL